MAYDLGRTRTTMKLGDIVKNAPNSLIWSVALCFIAIITAFTILSATGNSSDDLRAFLNTVLNIASTVGAGASVIVAGAAAKSAGNAEKQTNGALDQRITDAVRQALAEQDPRV